MDDTALLHEVREIRRELPRLGVRKLQVMLYQRGHDVGCDRLFDLLREAGMLVSRKRFRARTTDSRHWMRKWDNLIGDVVPVCMNQIWVSDITYVEIKAVNRSYWMYLSLITDAYTHEIVGYALHRRPHMSIGNLTPEEARSMKGEAAKLWKNYFARKHESVKTALACQ